MLMFSYPYLLYNTYIYIYVYIKNQPAHFQITHIQNNSQDKHWHPTRKLYQKGRVGSYSNNFQVSTHCLIGKLPTLKFFQGTHWPQHFQRWRSLETQQQCLSSERSEICLPRTKCFLRRLYEVQGGWRSRLSSESSSVLGGKLLVTLWLNAVFNGCTLQRVFGIIKMQSPTDTNGAHTQQSFPSGFGVFCIGPLFGKSIHSCSG